MKLCKSNSIILYEIFHYIVTEFTEFLFEINQVPTYPLFDCSSLV